MAIVLHMSTPLGFWGPTLSLPTLLSAITPSPEKFDSLALIVTKTLACVIGPTNEFPPVLAYNDLGVSLLASVDYPYEDLWMILNLVP